MPAETRKAPGAPGPPVEAAGPSAPRSFRGCRSGTPAGRGSPVTLQLWLIIPGGVRAARRCRAPSGFPGAPPPPQISWASSVKAAELSSSWECKGQEVVGQLQLGVCCPGVDPSLAVQQLARSLGESAVGSARGRAGRQRNFSLENISGGRGDADRA